MSTCQTCYSSLPSSSLHSTYRTPCCDTPICANCLARNPRLRYYDPCLRCGDVRTESGEARIREGKARSRAEQRAEEEGQFAIGDSDDEDDDRPPSYSEKPTALNDDYGEQSSGSSSKAISDGGGGRTEPTSKGETEKVDEADEDTEIVEVKHPISGSDTLWTIARRYGADPYDLLSLNSLPPTALTSNPRIIQTRKTLIITRRRVPRGSLPDTTLFDAGEALDPDEEERREEERRVKRFQLITKTTDVGVGRAYLGLAEIEGERHPLEDGSGEALEIGDLDFVGAHHAGRERGGGKKARGGGKEDRALDAFWEDSAWEAEVGGPERVKVNGRWTVVGSPLPGLSIKS